MSVTEKLGAPISPVSQQQQPSIINQQIPPDEVTAQFVQIRKTMEKGDQQTKNLGTALSTMVLRAALNVNTDLEATTDLFLMNYDIADQNEQQKARDTVNPFFHATRKDQIESSLDKKEVKSKNLIQLEMLNNLRAEVKNISRDIIEFTTQLTNSVTSLVTISSVTNTMKASTVGNCFDDYCKDNSNFVIKANEHIDFLKEKTEKIKTSQAGVGKVIKDLLDKNEANRRQVEQLFTMIMPDQLLGCHNRVNHGGEYNRPVLYHSQNFGNQSVLNLPKSNEEINVDASNVNQILVDISRFNLQVKDFKKKVEEFQLLVTGSRPLLNPQYEKYQKIQEKAKAFPEQNENLKNEWKGLGENMIENNRKLEAIQKFLTTQFTEMLQDLQKERETVITETNNHITAGLTFAKDKELTSKEELKLFTVEVK